MQAKYILIIVAALGGWLLGIFSYLWLDMLSTLVTMFYFSSLKTAELEAVYLDKKITMIL